MEETIPARTDEIDVRVPRKGGRENNAQVLVLLDQSSHCGSSHFCSNFSLLALERSAVWFALEVYWFACVRHGPALRFPLSFLTSQFRRSARLAAQRAVQQAQAVAIDLTDVENNSDAFSDDPVALSDVDLLSVPSCVVFEGHFADSVPFSRSLWHCCDIAVHLQCSPTWCTSLPNP